MGFISNGVLSRQGNRPEMEDRHILINPSGCCLAAVFDGHNGAQVAQICKDNFHVFFAEGVNEGKVVSEALRRAFLETDKLCPWPNIGACAIAVFIQNGLICVANAGDCRAVIIGDQFHQISNVHRLGESGEETTRVAHLGFLIQDHQIYIRDPDDEGRYIGLQPTRSIGDKAFRPAIIAEPEVSLTATYKFPNSKFLVLGSDGLFDVIWPAEFVSAGQVAGDIEDFCWEISRLLAGQCLPDDVTMVVVDLRS